MPFTNPTNSLPAENIVGLIDASQLGTIPTDKLLGMLAANRISTGTFNELYNIAGLFIVGAAGTKRVEIGYNGSKNGVRLYDAANNLVVDLDATTGAGTFSGTIESSTFDTGNGYKGSSVRITDAGLIEIEGDGDEYYPAHLYSTTTALASPEGYYYPTFRIRSAKGYNETSWPNYTGTNYAEITMEPQIIHGDSHDRNKRIQFYGDIYFHDGNIKNALNVEGIFTAINQAILDTVTIKNYLKFEMTGTTTAEIVQSVTPPGLAIYADQVQFIEKSADPLAKPKVIIGQSVTPSSNAATPMLCIGTDATHTPLLIRAPAGGKDLFQAQNVDGTSIVRIANNGDYIGQDVTCIICSTTLLRASSTTDLTGTSTNHALQLGPSNASNLRADPNEIAAFNNGAPSTLNVGSEADVNLGLRVSATGGSFVKVTQSGTAGLIRSNTSGHDSGMKWDVSDVRTVTASGGAFNVHRASAFTVSSDKRKKKDIRNLGYSALEAVKKARSKVWKYTEDHSAEKNDKIGPMAEDLPPEVISETHDNNGDPLLTVDLHSMLGLLWEAVNELSSKVESLERKAPGNAK